jgi:imidazole glycerol-phosphate synthase subunit HisH
LITIVDYGMGNLRSVQKGFERVGHAARISSDPRDIDSASKLVLPGVGAFGDGVRALHERGLAEPIKRWVRADKPFLGICLGLQMLFTKGYEDGEQAGLDLFPGVVRRFSPGLGVKIPHMGWNDLDMIRRPSLLEGFPADGSVYFVHSYLVVPESTELIACTTTHGESFVSMIWQGNIFATQFHPEKSQELGLAILRKFADLGNGDRENNLVNRDAERSGK